MEYKCDFTGCDQIYLNISDLDVHKKTHSVENPYRCDFKGCDYTSDNTSNVIRHKSTHSNEKPFKCYFGDCDHASKTSGDLQQHQMVHSSERPFKCDFKDCDKRFKKNAHLKRHQSVHCNEKPFKCDFKGCDKTFKRSDDLNNHKKRHNDKKPYKCDFKDCDKAFKTSSDLSAHKIRHSLERPYECDFKDCDLGFKTITELNNHQKIHTGNKLFKCNYDGCDYAYYTSGNITRHKLTHTGEYKYYCEECGDLFREKANLERHINNIHSGKIVAYEKKEEKIFFDLLKSNNIMFDYNVTIDFCKITDKKQRAFADFVIQNEYGIIFLEVDEHHGHYSNNLKTDDLVIQEIKCESEVSHYNVLCEQARMMNMLASTRAEGITKPVCFLRYNPNTFKNGKSNFVISQEDRGSKLIDFIINWRPKQDLEIHYYCYDEYSLDDENKTRRVCVWEHKDFDPKLQEHLYIV